METVTLFGVYLSMYITVAACLPHLDKSVIVDLKIVSPRIIALFGAGSLAGKLDRSCVEKLTVTGASDSATYQAGGIAGVIEAGGTILQNAAVEVTLLQGPNAQTTRAAIGAAGGVGGLIGEVLDGGAGENIFNDLTLNLDLTADTPPLTSGVGGVIGSPKATVKINNLKATGVMHCLSSPCLRSGRISGFGTQDPIIQNTTVELSKTDSWQEFKEN